MWMPVFMLPERNAVCLIGPLPDVLKPDIQCVRTHWNRGFMAFQLTRRTRIVVLMMPTWPESGSGRGREFGINGESSGKDGVNTNGRSSPVFSELLRVTCGVVVHKAVDNHCGMRITGGILWTRCG